MYNDDQLNVKREATLRAARWLTDRVAILRAQAIKAEEEVQDYRAEHGLLQVTGTRFDAKELTGLQGELIGTQVELSEIEAKIEVVQSMRQQGAEAGSLAEVLVSPLVGELRRQLIALQRQQTQLLNDYGTRHPAVVNVRSEIEQLSADLRSELGTIAGALENQLRILRNREATIEDKIAAAKSQSLSIDEAETRLDELQRTAHVTRAQYDSFLKRLKEVNEQQDLLEPGARLALRATEPADASFPKPNLIIAAGFVSSLLLGALLAFVREYLDTTLRSGHQLEQAFGLPNWGYVPNVKGLKSTQRPHTYLVEKPRSGYAAGLEGLRVALELSDHENPPQAVLVTSSVPDEGKTSLAIGLSVIAARSGIKTIVVDLDLRRPSVHKELGLKVRHCLFDYMAGECSIDDAIYHGGSPYDFDALPLTKPPARSLDMLRDERMAELITALRQRYDYIVLDSAPVLGLSDTVVASRLADAAVFAVRWSKTEEGMVRNALNGFLRGRMSTVGTVLTRVNPARQKSYRYGDDIQYYGKFEKYYLN
ncbi:MAG: GumC family protein [Geminicoccaceae bacterium]